MLTDFACPNGLAFGPDTQKLDVPGSGRMFGSDPLPIRASDAGDDQRALTGGEVFDRVDPGRADGLRCDEDGNLCSSAAHGRFRMAPDGRLLGTLLVPETVSNLCFGGRAGHRLFITASTGLYTVALNRRGRSDALNARGLAISS